MYILIRAGNTLSWVCFGLVQIFCARPNIYVNRYCGSHKHFVPDKKMICIQCRHKCFWRGTKCSQLFGLAQKVWTGKKHFGTCKRTRHEGIWATDSPKINSVWESLPGLDWWSLFIFNTKMGCCFIPNQTWLDSTNPKVNEIRLISLLP